MQIYYIAWDAGHLQVAKSTQPKVPGQSSLMWTKSYWATRRVTFQKALVE